MASLDNYTRYGLYLGGGVLVSFENFSLIWRRHYYCRRAKILTYNRHSWPLNSEGSLMCHTFNDFGLTQLGIKPRSPV